MAIIAKNLSHDYIRRSEDNEIISIQRALKNINIEIQEGSFVAILGSNGSGKSTFAKHLNALLSPTEGSLWVDGIDTTSEEQLWELRTHTGMVFQNPDNQIIANVVEEDVGFGPENIGIPTETIWERVKNSLQAVRMWDYRKSSPNHLSGGQKQRVAIAGVIAMKPKCIVLDEPTAMLDPNGRKEVIDTILKLNKTEKITVILITHYMEEVIHADQVFVMNQGEVVMTGKPREIFSKADELEGYRLDVPQITRIASDLKKKGLPIPEGILTIHELEKVLKPLLQ